MSGELRHGRSSDAQAVNAQAAHQPVLLDEVIAALQPRADAIMVDGTFGAGGYANGLLQSAPCRVIGIDRDPDATANAAALVRRWAPRLVLIEGRFGDMDRLLADRGVNAVDGVTLDLGVSSMQIDQPERGFSFRFDGPLDMRMERTGATAAELVNTASESDLADIVFQFGEERYARRIARAIVKSRLEAPIERTLQLADLVRRACPKGKDSRIDPATRTFQALRIYVNDELGELRRGLEAAARVLRPGGRLAVVSFHSLEDRAVKRFMRDGAGDMPRPSRHILTANDRRGAPTLRLVTRRPIVPGEAEMARNPRSRSAKLRVAEAAGAGADA